MKEEEIEDQKKEMTRLEGEHKEGGKENENSN
jgi:hypothetical protein